MNAQALAAGGGPGAIGTSARFTIEVGRFYELRSNVEIVWSTKSSANLDNNAPHLYPSGHPARFVADSNELVVAEVGSVAGGVAWLWVEADDNPRRHR